MNLAQLPGGAETLAAVRAICEQEKGRGRVIDAPFGLPGVIENGTWFLSRKPSQYIDGRHFTAYVADVVAMKRTRDYEAAEQLLLRICDVIEGEDVVPPWYYEHLAIIYRKQGKRQDEIALLKRAVLHSGARYLHARLAKLLSAQP